MDKTSLYDYPTLQYLYMSNFQFNEEQSQIVRRNQAAKPKGIQGRLIRWGVAKNESQANLIMIVIVVVSFLVIIYQQVDLFGSTPAEVIDPSLVP